MKNVTIVQRRLTHYRVALFEELRARLAQDGVRLRLLHGDARPEELPKKDSASLSWAELLPTRYMLREKLCWQPFANMVTGEDLVIITQENSMLANHFAVLRPPAKRLAFWGHGANLQGDRRSLRERFKTWSTRQVDWYFAYTKLSAELVAQSGFPLERITNLNNSVDLTEIRQNLQIANSEGAENLRSRFGLKHGPVGLYLGSLYPHKRLDFLLEASRQIRDCVPRFQLVIVGAGPQQPMIEKVCTRHSWMHYLGPQRGLDKARILVAANVILNPGLVGLGVLDAFVSETPMLTTDCGLHSPEIVYLTADNGIMAPDDIGSYVEACVALLSDHSRMRTLKSGCRQAAELYTLPNMINNFAAGIKAALQVSPR